MPPAITCFVNPRESYKMTDIVKKLQAYFEVYVDSVNLDPILMKAKYGGSVHKFFAHDNGDLIMYDYEIVDMVPPEFVVTTDRMDKQGWITFFNFLKQIFAEEEPDQMLIDQVKDMVRQQKCDLKHEASIRELENPKVPTEYMFDCEIDAGRNMCFCQITKPFTDRPYTLVIRNFSENGYRSLVTSLFIDSSWGFSHDIEFLHHLWKHLGLIYEFGELNLEKELKEHTERCTPRDDGKPPEKEPEVYRMSIEALKTEFNMRNKRYREVMEDLNVKRQCL